MMWTVTAWDALLACLNATQEKPGGGPTAKNWLVIVFSWLCAGWLCH